MILSSYLKFKYLINKQSIKDKLTRQQTTKKKELYTDLAHTIKQKIFSPIGLN